MTSQFPAQTVGAWREYARFSSSGITSNQVSFLVRFPGYLFDGLDFGPYLPGQSPGRGIVLSDSQLRARIALIAPFTRSIRTYGSTSGLENISRVAREFGLATSIGAWLSADTTSNALEISNLINQIRQGTVDEAVVGSEVLLRKDLTEAQLLSYIGQVGNV